MTITRSAIDLAGGRSTGIGGLPHRDPAAAADFVLATMGIPAIPTLSRRSPSEGYVAKALVGMTGVTLGQYGSISLDLAHMDPGAPIVTDLSDDAFLGFRTFLDHARVARAEGRFENLVKWQFIGPVTFGMTLVRAGMPVDDAFSTAVRVVRERLQHLLTAVETALPGSTQLVVVEEPVLAELHQPGFLVPPDTAIDLVSGALAMIESSAVSALHVCGDADGALDVPSLLATGPAVLSVPVRSSLVDVAGYLVRFLERGGVVAWGVVPTSGPASTTVERPWRRLVELWSELVRHGAEPDMLRRQSIVTPECGLAAHSPAIAERVHRIVADIAERLHDPATTARWTFGA